MQERFLPFVKEVAPTAKTRAGHRGLPGVRARFLQWPDDCLCGLDPARPVPDELRVSLPDAGETLNRRSLSAIPFHCPARPKPELLNPNSPRPGSCWPKPPARHRPRRPHSRDERAGPRRHATPGAPARETRVPIGLLTNGTQIRLIYAPHGENSGNITFTVRYMAEVAGRPILAALHMLLGECCSAAAPSTARLPALLARSREYQSTVSTQLAARSSTLYELLRGFQAADERAKGELLRAVLAKNPDDIYSGLLTVLMRMVFLLFAEDRGIVPPTRRPSAPPAFTSATTPSTPVRALRADAERYPDTMDQRYARGRNCSPSSAPCMTAANIRRCRCRPRGNCSTRPFQIPRRP